MQIKVSKENQALLAALAESQGLNINQLANRFLDRGLRPELYGSYSHAAASPMQSEPAPSIPEPDADMQMDF